MVKNIKLTDSLKKALLIIRDRNPQRPSEFAFMMWHDSPKWKTQVKCGKNGVSRGGGMRLAAGGYLGRLKANGFIVIKIGEFNNTYILTDKAQQLLNECLEN